MTDITRLVQTICRKILIAIWVFIIAILIGIPIIGYFQGELLGYIAFGIFPVAILLNISIIISYVVKDSSLRIAKIGWVVLCIAVIGFVSVIGDPRQSTAIMEAGMLIGYSMMVLSFPLSVLYIYIYGGLFYLFDYLRPSGSLNLEQMSFYISNFIFWLGFFIIGYLQWFKLLPYLIEKWKARKVYK